MRSVPALLLCLLIFAPISFTMDIGSIEKELPFPLDDVKLKDVGWKFPLTSFVKDATIEWTYIDGGDLFLLDSKNTIHCIEVARGVHRWVLDLPGKPTYPVGVSSDSLGVVIKNRLIIARRDIGKRILEKDLAIYPATTPATTVNSAYFGMFIQNKLVSVAMNGMEGWSYRFKEPLAVAPQIAGEGAESLLYATSNGGDIICLPVKAALDSPPNKVEWSLKARGRNTSDFVIAGDLLYIASEDTSLYAINRQTGGIKWKYYAGVSLKKAPQVRGENLFIDKGDDFICFNSLNGAMKWNYANGLNLIATINELAYIWTRDGKIAVIEIATGKVFKETEPSGTISVVPNVYSDMLVYISGTDVYGLK